MIFDAEEIKQQKLNASKLFMKLKLLETSIKLKQDLSTIVLDQIYFDN